MDDNHQELDTYKENQVAGLMRWVRLLLPVVLAALGWYVGNVIGQFDDRIVILEKELNAQIVICAVQNSESNIRFSDILRRLQDGETRDIREHENILDIDTYLREIADLKKRIDILEKQ